MAQDHTLVIKNGYVQKMDKIVDVGVSDGQIATVEESINEDGADVIDAEGNLVSPAFVDPHIRLGRTLTAEGGRVPASNSPPKGSTIEDLNSYYEEYSHEKLVQNAVDTIQKSVNSGTTYIRSHVAVDMSIGLDLYRAVQEAVEQTNDICTVELVPASSTGIMNEEAESGIREVLSSDEFNAEPVVGGAIWLTNKPGPVEDVQERVDKFFEIALDHDADIDIHMSQKDTASYYIYKRLFEKVREHGYQGRVTTIHNYALAQLEEWWSDSLIEDFKELDLNMMATTGSLNPFYPVEEIMDTGITFAHCTDNNRDMVTPHGNADQLEYAYVLTYKRRWGTRDKNDPWKYNDMLGTIGKMITDQAAGIVNYDGPYGITEGARADLVLVDEPSIHWAISNQPVRKYVIKDGNVVVEDGKPVPEYKVSDYQ